jgi:flagellar basal body-associated protein FliL
MPMNFELVKKHPYTFGGGLLAVFLITYLLRHKSSGGGYTYVNGLDPQTAAIQAAASQQQLAYNAQLDTNKTNAQTAQAAIAAQQAIASKQYDDALMAAQAQFAAVNKATDAAVTVAQLQATTTQQGQSIQKDLGTSYLDYLKTYSARHWRISIN